MSTRILIGDCRRRLAELPDASVHCVVSSPPYFGLRDYGVDGQIGLEETPDAFVAEMVAVFREVRRVLRDDGTLWLNLGDSYNAAGREGHGTRLGYKQGTNRASATGADNPRPSVATLKPKDLIGIPWRVARALQEPYYTGRIKRLEDRVWLAAMIDGEGCMFIHKRKAGTDSGSKFIKADGTEVSYARTQDTYGAGLEVANTSLAIVERCMAIAGVGSICRQDKDRRQPLYRWNVRSNECRWIVQEVYPHLVGKQHQARLLLGCPSSGKDAEAAHAGLIGLHNGSTTAADFPPPKSMFEQGYYLRQDIIWSKLNPMPESVTDRCTKAHEYLFLLSKSARYHFDASAISEAVDVEYLKARWGGSLDRTGENGQDTIERSQATGKAQALGIGADGRRNRRSVWTVATQPFSEAHFATFPPALIEPCILAGCPVGGTVLDPFGGAGTTGLVADRLGRNAILIELNPAYATMAEKRIAGDAGLFSSVAAE